MHILRTNLLPCSSITVSAVGDSFASVSMGKPWTCLHACSQLRQPMHFVMSTRIALVRSMFSSLPRFSMEPRAARRLLAGQASPPSRRSRQEKLLQQLLPDLRCHTRDQPRHGHAAVGRHPIQPGHTVLQPRRHHAALHQILLIDCQVWRLYGQQPSLFVGIAGNDFRVLHGVTIDVHDHALTGDTRSMEVPPLWIVTILWPWRTQRFSPTMSTRSISPIRLAAKLSSPTRAFSGPSFSDQVCPG